MFTVSGVQPTPAKKGNTGRRKYPAQTGGASFARHLANAIQAAEQRQDGFNAQAAWQATGRARENDVNTLWQRVQRVNAEITDLLLNRKDVRVLW